MAPSFDLATDFGVKEAYAPNSRVEQLVKLLEQAPLPDPWQISKDEAGKTEYRNGGFLTSEHPLMGYFKALVHREVLFWNYEEEKGDEHPEEPLSLLIMLAPPAISAFAQASNQVEQAKSAAETFNNTRVNVNEN